MAYRRALDLYYDSEQPLPIDNIPSLSRRLMVGIPDLEVIIKEFFPDGKNKRADEEIAAYHRYIEIQKANGKLGGRPVTTQRKPTANPSLTHRKPNAKPNTNHKPLTNIKTLSASALLASLGINNKIAADWITLRQAKKAPVTETAIRGIAKQAEMAGMHLENALTVCCERGWTGFKAAWLNSEVETGYKSRQCEYAGCGKLANTRTYHGWRCIEHMSADRPAKLTEKT